MNPLIATQPVYQADMDVLQSIHHCREKIQFICRQHMHRCVHVQTTSGQVYEGTVVGVDEHHLYLDLSQTQSGMRQYPYPYPIPAYNPYASSILPLVLYNLLVISLL